MKISTIGLTAATVALLGVLAAPAVHAAEVKGEAKDTQTQVNIIDSPDPAILKLTHVPEQYKFETKLQSTGEYSLNGGVVSKDVNMTVFNDKSTQDWSLKASVDDTVLTTKDGRKSEVTGFKINGQSLMGADANQNVYQAAKVKTIDNNTGNISKKVTNEGLSISFNNAAKNLKAGDVLTGKVHYQLYDTPDIK